MKDIRLVVVIALVAILAGFLGFYLNNIRNNPQPTASVTVTPSLSTSPIPTETTPTTATTTPSTTTAVTPTPLNVKDLIVTSETAANPGNGTTYSFGFSKCSSAHCDHYLLPALKNASFPILSTRTPEDGAKYLLASNTKQLDSAAGNSYFELISGTTLYVGTVFDGLQKNMLGDGKDYYSFTYTSVALSNTTKYLYDKSKTSASLKALLVDSRKGKTAYIAGKPTSAGAAAGTHYFYLTTGFYVAFK